MKLLSQGIGVTNPIFGSTIAPPAAFQGVTNPLEGAGILLGTGIRLVIFAGSIAMLIYLLWGAFEWVSSGGEKEKISKAQSKMTHAVIGMIMLFVALAGFYVVSGNVLGIVYRDKTGNWIFNLPILGK